MADEVTIRIRDDGPALIEGKVKVLDGEGNAFAIDPAKPGIAICRCGQSQSRPFCDGSHRQCGFTASERAGT